MKISTELINQWVANYEHGDYQRIAKHGSANGKTFTAENIRIAFKRGAAGDDVVRVINDYFEHKKKFHKRLINQLVNA